MDNQHHTAPSFGYQGSVPGPFLPVMVPQGRWQNFAGPAGPYASGPGMYLDMTAPHHLASAQQAIDAACGGYQPNCPPAYQGGVIALGGLAVPGPAVLDRKTIYAQYRKDLMATFRSIREGDLAAASDMLLRASLWLQSHVEELGLIWPHVNQSAPEENPNDNEGRLALYKAHLELWRNFNHAWLALFQKQKDLLEGRPEPSQTLITRKTLEEMGNRLVKFANEIEQHGLVDYECGLWEEQIVSIIMECQDLLDAKE